MLFLMSMLSYIKYQKRTVLPSFHTPINTESPSAGQPPVTSTHQQPQPLTTHQGKLALAVPNIDSTGDTAVISLLLNDDGILINDTIFL